MKPLAECRLYTFVDTAYLAARSAATVARQLCEGGSDIVQLRAKGKTPEEVLALGREILPVVHSYGVRLVINDHWQIAQELGADLCHLGQEDYFDNDTRPTTAPSGPGLGLSTHSPEQAARSLAVNPAYIAIGPVFATPTKPQANPVTLNYVRWAAQHVAIPWFAIGGINPGNLEEVLAAGATRVCVVSAVLNAPDIAAACRALKARLAGRKTG